MLKICIYFTSEKNLVIYSIFRSFHVMFQDIYQLLKTAKLLGGKTANFLQKL